MLGGVGIYPSNFWQGGMAYIIIPHVVNSKQYSDLSLQKSPQINRFCSKNDWFLMILAKFYQKFLPKCRIWVSQAQRTVFFYSSSALNLCLKVYSLKYTIPVPKIQNFPASERGMSTSDTPLCAELALMHHQIIKKKYQGWIYAPVRVNCSYSTRSYIMQCSSKEYP